MIDKNIIDEINEKTDIVALVSNYVHLEKQGKNYKGLCPFHDDTNPSFVVSPEKNISKCFSCNEGGAPIRFYQKINNVSFEDAVIALAEPLGIKLNLQRTKTRETLKEHEALKEATIFYDFSLHRTVSGEEALKYLKSRKLNLKTIQHFNIGYAPNEDLMYKLLNEKGFSDQEILDSNLVTKHQNRFVDTFKHRIMFPITNDIGQVVGFSGRSLGKQEPKYYNSQESVVFRKSEVLYHLYEALGDIRKAQHIILHEGFFDCIASYEAGLKNTVATMGTALTLKQAELIKKYTNRVIIAFDGDKAGIDATLKAIDVFKQVRIRVDILKLDDALDPDDYLKTYGKEKYKALYKNNLMDPYRFTYEVAKEGLNLKNANDVSILKNIVRDMLVGTQQSIKEHYINRLSQDLNVSAFSLSNLLTYQQVKETKEIKPKKELIPNKFYQAEKILFINMFKSKEHSSRIEQALGTYYVCDSNVAKLRMILHFKYYQMYETFDEELFISLVSEETDNTTLLEVLSGILKMDEYNNETFEYTEENIEEYIRVLKTVNDYKKYQKLLADVKAETESYQKTILMEEQKRTKLEIIE